MYDFSVYFHLLLDKKCVWVRDIEWDSQFQLFIKVEFIRKC